MDIRELLRLAGRRWTTIVGVFTVAIAIAGVFSYLITPTYVSTTRLYVSIDTGRGTDSYSQTLLASTKVASYAKVVNSRALMTRVIKDLELDDSPSTLASRVSASVDTGTVILTIKAEDSSPGQARKIVQSTTDEFTSYVREIDDTTGSADETVKTSVIDTASPAVKVSPRTVLNLLVAGLLGLLLGLAIAVLRELLDSTVKTIEDVRTVTEAPVLANLEYSSSVANAPLLTDKKNEPSRWEAFRVLATNLQFLDLDSNPRAFVITSAVPGDGKTVSATNLAIALSQAGRRVLLVDADLRRPGVASLLGMESAVGLTTVLVGRSSLEDSLQRHTESGVYVLTSGPIPPNPAEILQSHATRDLIGKLRASFDLVIIDSPPLLPVADGAIMATLADGAIITVRHGSTTRDQLKVATERLGAVGARLWGIVVSMSPPKADENYGYGYDAGRRK